MSFPDTPEVINAAELAVNQAFQQAGKAFEQAATAAGSLVGRIKQYDTLSKTFEAELASKAALIESQRQLIANYQTTQAALETERDALKLANAELDAKVKSMAAHPDVVAAELARIEQQEATLKARKEALQGKK